MHTRRKTELSIRFRIRNTVASQPRRQLQIRLTVDGNRITDYASGIYIAPEKWDQHTQQVKGRNQLATQANERLAEIIAQHHEILRELKRRHAKGEGLRPTAKMVRAEFITPGSTSPSLIDCFKTYLRYLNSLHGSEDGLAEKTVDRVYKTLDYLLTFGNPTYANDRKPVSPLLTDLNTGWAKRFHAWLQIYPHSGKRRMQKDSANKYLTHVRQAVDHAVDEGFLSNNPLDKFRPKRGKGKEVYFLEPHHLDRFWQLDNQGKGGECIWWMGVIFLTGLDHPDAVRYVQNRHLYEQDTLWGKQIVICRSKPPRSECYIPVLPELEALLQRIPAGEPPTAEQINDYMKGVEVLIGFPHRLTCKVGRKTAGAIFFSEYEDIGAVSKMLGHSSVTITERYYVKTTAHTVNKAMQKRYVSSTTYQPFRRDA